MFKTLYDKISTLLVTFSVVFIGAITNATAGELSGELIAKEVQSRIAALALEQSLEVEISIPRVHDVTAPGVDDPGMKITVLDGFNGPRIRSLVEVLDTEGKTVRTVQCPADVSVFKNIAVVVRDIARGELVEPVDVEYKRENVSNIDGYFEESKVLDDMLAARSIRVGTPLTKAHVKPVPLIKRGDRIMVTARIGNVYAVMEGTARQDGGRGETIRVVNEETRKSFEGVVINERTIQVGF